MMFNFLRMIGRAYYFGSATMPADKPAQRNNVQQNNFFLNPAG